jgi:hypothetical protein
MDQLRAIEAKRSARSVVLIEFWTFGCYNCRNTLPSLKAGTIVITTKA